MFRTPEFDFAIVARPDDSVRSSVPLYAHPESCFFVDRHGNIRTVSRETQDIERRFGVFAVISAHGNTLFTKPPWAPSFAELPGGGIEKGETILEAMRREIMEETGLIVNPRAFKDPKIVERQRINFCAEAADGTNLFYDYSQTFLHYDISDFIAPEDFAVIKTDEGSVGFWYPSHKTEELTLRFDHINSIQAAILPFYSNSRDVLRDRADKQPKIM